MIASHWCSRSFALRQCSVFASRITKLRDGADAEVTCSIDNSMNGKVNCLSEMPWACCRGVLDEKLSSALREILRACGKSFLVCSVFQRDRLRRKRRTAFIQGLPPLGASSVAGPLKQGVGEPPSQKKLHVCCRALPKRHCNFVIQRSASV